MAGEELAADLSQALDKNITFEDISEYVSSPAFSLIHRY